MTVMVGKVAINAANKPFPWDPINVTRLTMVPPRRKWIIKFFNCINVFELFVFSLLII